MHFSYNTSDVQDSSAECFDPGLQPVRPVLGWDQIE